MYYKVKINYNKSELSLISLDKDVIEREMDLYFAYFANASEEFVSKIKKVEIVHPKIKPIDEIVSNAINKKEDSSINGIETIIKNDTEKNDVVLQNNELQSTLQSKENKPVENKTEKQAKESVLLKADNFSNNNFNQIIDLRTVDAQKIKSQIEEIKIANENNNKENNTERKLEEIKIQNEPLKEKEPDLNSNQNENIIEKYGFDKKEEEITPQYLEIQNMIKMAQSEINSKNDEAPNADSQNIEQEEDINKEEETNNAQLKDNYSEELEKNLLLEFSENNEETNEAQTSSDIQITRQNTLSEDDNDEELIEIAQDIEETPTEPAKKYIEEEDFFKKNVQISTETDFEETDLVFGKNKSRKQDELHAKQNKEVLYDIFENSNVYKEIHELQNAEIQRLQENIEKQNDLLNKKIINDMISEQNQVPHTIIEKPTETELLKFAQDLDNAIQQGIQKQEESLKNEDLIPVQNNPEEEPLQNNKTTPENTNQDDDFTIFLKMYETESIEDMFLICAYYTKNILSKQSFTMKCINAKLFKAAEKIAGISILEGLIEKGYIEQVQNGDTNSYSITQEGEKYFEDCFQR